MVKASKQGASASGSLKSTADDSNSITSQGWKPLLAARATPTHDPVEQSSFILLVIGECASVAAIVIIAATLAESARVRIGVH